MSMQYWSSSTMRWSPRICPSILRKRSRRAFLSLEYPAIGCAPSARRGVEYTLGGYPMTSLHRRGRRPRPRPLNGPSEGRGSVAPMLDSRPEEGDVATRLSDTSHEALGLSGDDLLSMYRAMVTARLCDEAAFRLNRQGKAPFVVPVSGHEGCQVGTAWALERGRDIWLPYYRDLAVVLVAGMTPKEIFLGLFAKADDPSSGGRQMPSHWGSRRLSIISHSSPIGTQL